MSTKIYNKKMKLHWTPYHQYRKGNLHADIVHFRRESKHVDVGLQAILLSYLLRAGEHL